MLLNHNAAPSYITGLICNVDMTASLNTLSNTIKVYLWAFSLSPTNSLALKVYGCTPGSSCSADQDFNVALGGGKTYNTNDLQVEMLTLNKHTDANTATVSVNSGSVYYFIILACRCIIYFIHQKTIPQIFFRH